MSKGTSKRRKKPPMTFNDVNSWGVSIPKAQELQQETAISCNCVRLAVAYETKKVGIKTLTK